MTEYLRSVEVAVELKIHPATLRRWEERGLVAPLRDHNGVRYYTQEQVEQLKATVRPKLRAQDKPRLV